MKLFVVCVFLVLACSVSTLASEEVAEANPRVKGDKLECSLCKLILTEVEKLLGENRTQETIIKALDRVGPGFRAPSDESVGPTR